jgi:hypothetical protein
MLDVRRTEMPFEIKIDVIDEGNVALWHRREPSPGGNYEWRKPCWGILLGKFC